MVMVVYSGGGGECLWWLSGAVVRKDGDEDYVFGTSFYFGSAH